MKAKVKPTSTPSAFQAKPELAIHPRLPYVNGIFDLPANTLIAAHAPHAHIVEHLHDHLPHLHIRYGFEIPLQNFSGISAAALQVAMMIKIDQRVDCNPIFVGRGPGAEGVCWKVGGQDVHWVHNADVAEKATKLYQATGRRIPIDRRFIGFATSDLEERRLRRYTRAEFVAAIGHGLRADQHFQATWIKPRPDPIDPYEVTIFLSDDATDYHTFFTLPLTVPLGPS